ncbi:cysteine desulfurase [Patescibacteria group bacterium]|nr:cysteine desulfurase [Patescibacteria group bacterium]MBU1702897.1 cysteine desulfurase [Patescibacteria group bacterium]MBU1954062.1 cysteine desulfurase [Patescibacteria group bacterium]
MMFNGIKKDFPIFDREVNGKRLVYLDSASTSQKPRSVIDAEKAFYERMNANVHRGIHALSQEATAAYEGVREKVRAFIGAREAGEIVFTRGTTESINLVASTWGEQNISEGDEIVVSALEHHSNLVPWQQLCKRKKALLKVIPLLKNGLLNIDALGGLLGPRTKLVALTQMSNAIGTIVPIKKVVQIVRDAGGAAVGAGGGSARIKVLVDGAQSVAHAGFDLSEMPVDFLAFSSHKMLGPTGVGVLYVKREILETMPPYQFGGEMVKEVSQTDAKWNDLPWRFEAGTPNIAGVVGLGAALDYLHKLGFDAILKHDRELAGCAREKLSQFPGLVMYGPEDGGRAELMAGGIVSFNVPGVHPHDVGSILDNEGVAVRTGHHCAQPLMERLGCDATVRVSFYVYNDISDVDAAALALQKVYDIFNV